MLRIGLQVLLEVLGVFLLLTLVGQLLGALGAVEMTAIAVVALAYGGVRLTRLNQRGQTG